MALYTIELRRYIDSFSQYETGLSLNEKIERGRTRLFDFSYPFFDESKKKEFERLFIMEFYNREIGYETIGRFKLALETWLNINMVYWNKLLESENLKFEPFLNTIMDKNGNLVNTKDRLDTMDSVRDTKVDSNFSQDGTSKTVSDGTSDTDKNETVDKTGNKKDSFDDKENTNSFDRKLNSDTPDTRLQITTEDGKGIIEYASNIDEETNKSDRTLNHTGNEDTTSNQKMEGGSKTTTHEDVNNTTHSEGESGTIGKETGNNTLNSDIKTNEDTVMHYVGKVGNETYSEMLTKYRATFQRYYRDIYEEMNAELFMLVF